MRQQFKWLVLLVVGLLWCAVPLRSQQRIVGDVLVMLEHGSSVELTLKELQVRFPQAEVAMGENVAPSLNIWLFKTAPVWEQPVLDYLKSLPQVRLAQFNRIAEERNTPNDTIYPEQWNLENTGQGSGVPGADVKAYLAWDITTGGITETGDTIVVAIVDKGFELTHTDLLFWKNAYEISGDSIDNDGNGFVDDLQGWNVANQNDLIPSNSHGTLCAGIVGAKTNNLLGTAGINWGLPIMPVICSQYSESQVVAAYAYILETRRLYNTTNGARGAFVVATNSSFGIDYGFAADYPIWCAMYDSLGAQGILSAGATANINLDVEAQGDIPSTCTSDFLLVVTNTTRTDFKNPSAGFGSTSVDVGAPGTNIWSTTLGSGHSASTGTSFATPHVAGAVALLFSKACPEFMLAYRQYPDSMLRELKNIVLASVDSVPDLATSTTSGGRLNIFKALQRFQNDFCTTCLTINPFVGPVLCHGDATGSISLAIDSGRGPFHYQWSQGDTTAVVSNLLAGTYIVTVTDSVRCSRLGYYRITQPTPVQTGYIVQRSKGNDGSITVLVQGGVPPYQITWQDNVGTNDSATNLPPGAYGVTITDQNGCAKTDTVNVYLDSTIGVLNIALVVKHLALYPNPVNDRLFIDLQTTEPGTLSIEVLDLLGRQMVYGSYPVVGGQLSSSVGLPALPTGTYIVKLAFGGHAFGVYRVVKQ